MSKTDYWAKFEEHTVYHIYNRSINQEIIFKSDDNYHFFLKKWKALIEPFLEVGAYCLMPDHFHFLVWLKPLDEGVKQIIREQLTSKAGKFLKDEISYNEFLEDQFKRLFSSYALAFNKREGRQGSLFQKRFKRVALHEQRLWQIVAYIHHNPIHHTHCQEYGEWKYCSYQAYLKPQKTLVKWVEVLKWFGYSGDDSVGSFGSRLLNFKSLVNVDLNPSLKSARKEFFDYHTTFKLEKMREDDFIDL